MPDEVPTPEHFDNLAAPSIEISEAQAPETWLPVEVQQDERFNRAMATTPRPVLTYVLIAINVAVFIIMALNGFDFTNPAAESFLRWGADFGPLTTHGQWWRIVTAAFVHANFIHILMNMFILWSIGMFTERLFGRVAFFVLYLSSGIGGNLVSLAWQPFTIAMGASGAIFGLYGGLLALLLLHRNSVPRPRVLAIAKSAGIFVAFNLVYGMMQSNVDVAAHLGGLVTGFLLGCCLTGSLVPADPDWRQPRTFLVALAAAALAVVVALRLPVYDDWRSDLNRLIPLDANNQRIYSDALMKVQLHRMNAVQFAEVVDKQLLPPWNAERNNLSKLKLSTQQHLLANRLVEYMSLRSDAWSLMEKAIASTDPVLIRRSYQQQNAALAVLRGINQELAQARNSNGPQKHN